MMHVKMEKKQKSNRGLRRRIALFRGVFESAFPLEEERPWDLKIGSSSTFSFIGLRWEGELPDNVERFWVELDLENGSHAGLGYFFSANWGWIVSVYSREGEIKEWGHIHPEVLRALSHGLNHRKEYAQHVSRVYDFLSKKRFNLSLAQIQCDRSIYVLPPSVALDVARRLEQVQPKKEERRLYSFF